MNSQYIMLRLFALNACILIPQNIAESLEDISSVTHPVVSHPAVTTITVILSIIVCGGYGIGWALELIAKLKK